MPKTIVGLGGERGKKRTCEISTIVWAYFRDDNMSWHLEHYVVHVIPWANAYIHAHERTYVVVILAVEFGVAFDCMMY